MTAGSVQPPFSRSETAFRYALRKPAASSGFFFAQARFQYTAVGCSPFTKSSVSTFTSPLSSPRVVKGSPSMAASMLLFLSAAATSGNGTVITVISPNESPPL